MEIEAARGRAIAAMREFEEPGDPLTLIPSGEVEYEWCWLFAFNSVAAIEEDDDMAYLITGPLVVPKNGNPVWIAPSSPPVEQWLNQYAANEDLPAVPVPVSSDPFA
jgi:hypothetical protein